MCQTRWMCLNTSPLSTPIVLGDNRILRCLFPKFEFGDGQSIEIQFSRRKMYYGCSMEKTLLARELPMNYLHSGIIGDREQPSKSLNRPPWKLLYWRLSGNCMSLSLGESYGGSFLLSRFQILLQTVISDNTRKWNFEYVENC